MRSSASETLQRRSDLVDGVDLERPIAGAPGHRLGLGKVLRYTSDVASALAFAPEHGVLHRDVRPSNCLIERKSHRAFLSDFGVALRVGAKRVTMMAVGTRPYTAPELLRCGPGASRPAGDIYAVGTMLHEMLIGELPFDCTDDFETMQRVMTEPARPPSASVGDLPPGVDELVLQALQKNPDQRQTNGRALHDDLIQLRQTLVDSGMDDDEDADALPPRAAGDAPSVLVAVRSPMHPRSHDVPRRGLRIGFDADIALGAANVSGRHLTIAYGPSGGLVLTDNSTNGTVVNGQVVKQTTMTLGEGDFIQIGRPPRSPRFVVVKA